MTTAPASQSFGAAREATDGDAAPRRLRIAHVQLLPMLSGVQRVTLEELAALDPTRFDRTVICQGPGPLSDAAAAIGAQCEFVSDLRRPVAPRRDTTALVRLARLMRTHRYDIVHTHSSKTGVLGRFAARMAGAPAVVHTVHGFAFPAEPSRWKRGVYATMERAAGRCCDAVICLNSADRDTAAALGVAERRLHLIPNGVDLTRFQPLDAARRRQVRQRLGLPVDATVVAMVGRLWPQKDPQCFVDAAARLVGEGFTGHFVIVGDGSLRPELERRVAQLGIGNRLHLLGWRDDVVELLPSFDVFALPSRWEGMPLSILEALACGLPCVVSDIPGNRDLVTDRVDGFLVPVNDSRALAGRLGRLLGDAALRAALGRAARAKTERRFGLSRRTEAVLALYAELLADRARPLRPRATRSAATS